MASLLQAGGAGQTAALEVIDDGSLEAAVAAQAAIFSRRLHPVFKVGVGLNVALFHKCSSFASFARLCPDKERLSRLALQGAAVLYCRHRHPQEAQAVAWGCHSLMTAIQ